MDQFFGCRIVKALKHATDDYTIKTKKIDMKTLIIFGDSKNKDDFYFGKDFQNVKSFEPIAVEINVLMKLLGHQPINLETEYLDKINVYELRKVKDKHGKKRTVGFFSRTVPTGTNGFVNIGVNQTSNWSVETWPKSQLYWLPSENLVSNSFLCSKTKKCYYKANRKFNIEKHEKKCTDVQQIISCQDEFGSQNDEVTKASKIMDIDLSQFRQNNFCCFDIETFGKNDVCAPVSIAVASTLDGPKYFEKTNDSPEATYQMVSDFMEYLLELQEKLVKNLDPQIKQTISFLQAEKEENFNSKKYKSKQEITTMLNYFKNYEVLKVYGFNSRFVTNLFEHCSKCSMNTVQTVQ